MVEPLACAGTAAPPARFSDSVVPTVRRDDGRLLATTRVPGQSWSSTGVPDRLEVAQQARCRPGRVRLDELKDERFEIAVDRDRRPGQGIDGMAAPS